MIKKLIRWLALRYTDLRPVHPLALLDAVNFEGEPEDWTVGKYRDGEWWVVPNYAKEQSGE